MLTHLKFDGNPGYEGEFYVVGGFDVSDAPEGFTGSWEYEVETVAVSYRNVNAPVQE